VFKAADFLGRGREFREVRQLNACIMIVEAAHTSGEVGFILLTQLTEITTSLCIFYKQWHT